MRLVSLLRARPFPKDRRPRFAHDNDERHLLITTKQANQPKSGLTMTVNTGKLRHVINNQRAISTTRDNEGHECVSVIIVAALQEEIFEPKVLRVNRTRLTNRTVPCSAQANDSFFVCLLAGCSCELFRSCRRHLCVAFVAD